MADNHVVTFYSIEKIGDHKKVGRTVERHCIKNSIVGTFFSTPQGVNTTLSGKKKALIELVSLLEKKFKLTIKDEISLEAKSIKEKAKLKGNEKIARDLIDDIEQISKQPYEYTLDHSVLKLLREIDIIINDSKFRLRPEFKYKSKIIVNRDKINGLIDTLRLNMNKLSYKNYTTQLEKIMLNLSELEEEFEDSDVELSLIHI